MIMVSGGFVLHVDENAHPLVVTLHTEIDVVLAMKKTPSSLIARTVFQPSPVFRVSW